MNYKELFQRVWLLLSSPAKAWDEIKEEEDGKLLSAFVYPMIALCGLSLFVGILFGNGWDNFSLQVALTNCCSLFVSLFGGFYLASFLVGQIGVRLFDREESERERALCQKLVGYAMAVPFVLYIMSGLFPSFFILRWILQFYLIYLVWEGAKALMVVAEQKLLTYTILVSVVTLLSPALIGYLFNWLSSMAN